MIHSALNKFSISLQMLKENEQMQPF